MSRTVDMPPEEVAVLLGLPREDAPLFGSVAFRLDADLVKELRAIRGPIMLDFAMVERIFGVKVYTLREWRRKSLLACRTTGARGRFVVAPSEMVRRLRELQAKRFCTEFISSTPGQLSRRQKECRARMAGRIKLKN